jgi:hypothetical protein
MRSLKTAVAVGAALAALAGGTGADSLFNRPVHHARMVNCEDVDVQPCITYDDGALGTGWYRVDSYNPRYVAHKVKVCKGHRHYPCVQPNADGTFDYRFRGKF